MKKGRILAIACLALIALGVWHLAKLVERRQATLHHREECRGQLRAFAALLNETDGRLFFSDSFPPDIKLAVSFEELHTRGVPIYPTRLLAWKEVAPYQTYELFSNGAIVLKSETAE